MDISLTPEQGLILEEMIQGHNVFASGKAGCGKSRILAAFHEYAKRTKRNAVFLAPTGMAALALPEAMTIHKFFEFSPQQVFVNEADVRESTRMRQKLEHVDTIVLDEVSMVRADIFQAMDVSLRKHTGCFNRPFAGKQVIVVGDFNQLPPVIDDPKIAEYLSYYYKGIYAFCTPVWNQLHFRSFFLTQIMRQTDQSYIELLDALRTMKPGLKSMLQSAKFKVATCGADEIALCCRNKEAAAINDTELARIKSSCYVSNGLLTGRFPSSELPTDRRLNLKQTARVMVIQNQRMSGGVPSRDCYANGELGSVLNIDPDSNTVTVRLDRGPRDVRVSFASWDDYLYDLLYDSQNRPILKAEIVGRFYQFPLKLAWAISIHKAQGQTLEKVHLRLGRGCFSPGQLYTALTRVRNFDCLTMDRPIRYEDVLVDPQVMAFHQDTFPNIY